MNKLKKCYGCSKKATTECSLEVALLMNNKKVLKDFQNYLDKHCNDVILFIKQKYSCILNFLNIYNNKIIIVDHFYNEDWAIAAVPDKIIVKDYTCYEDWTILSMPDKISILISSN